MLYVTHLLSPLLMLVLPLFLGFLLHRRLKVGWSLFGVGALTFIGSQLLHIPFNAGLTALLANKVVPAPPGDWTLWVNAAVLGLSAGLFEEVARYLVYRFGTNSARTWRGGLMFGAGHGGVEAMIVGALAGLAAMSMIALRARGASAAPLPPELSAQLTAYWSHPWYYPLLGSLERVFVLCFHLSGAVLVLQVFTRRSLLWLGAAILWHAVFDAVALYTLATVGLYWTEAVIGVGALLSVGMVFALKPARVEVVAQRR
ncbi:hypothetical protein BE04_49385 [Sorangium cellulosum]|uniref:YhfC family intramembrane metalloprotease n=2 Tax=Sorangium cellulosum TaxID=56 RepID=A0A150P2V8_SORCE|nr:YhfC family glutamic-type intramembrane protease [Sorangium cellulosum]AGP39579.1 hypothetical protein SCE1572_36870 [Sorangium cellulosum So0157-2]KYF49805.1 hypothetical protein BE04_49385 [Sorangium cellulosum]KYG00882.1 hypothetical protein BE21_57010 [Sorangium cellulosum]